MRRSFLGREVEERHARLQELSSQGLGDSEDFARGIGCLLTAHSNLSLRKPLGNRLLGEAALSVSVHESHILWKKMFHCFGVENM